MPKSARQRMVESAAVLIRQQGVDATSFSDVVVASGAPRGSIYHYFPRGKAQLVEEATRHGSEFVLTRLAAALEQSDTGTALQTFGQFYDELLRGSQYTAGCPVLAAALEGERSPGARDAAGEGFARWEALIAAALRRDGVSETEAPRLSTLIVAGVEGAVVLCRAQRTTAPLQRVLDQLGDVILRAGGVPARQSAA